MESSPQKSLERVISQKALQMSSSSYCKAWVVGFLCGACITYLFLVCLSSFRTLEFGVVYSASAPEKSRNYGSEGIGLNKVADVVHLSRNTERVLENYSNAESILSDAELLYSAWNAMLNGSELNGRLNSSTLPRAPHLEDCAMNDIINRQYDSRRANESFPPWMIWKGLLGLEQSHFKRRTKSEGAYPPWIVGSDEENFPLTRKVQRDLWIHQHPLNCYNPGLRFLVTDWERLPGFGIGAQLAGMSGLFAIAINENRVLVTSYFNRADHDGCQGSSRSHWSCYFFLETSIECREYALGLLTNREAWERGIITGKENYTSKEIWAGRIPRAWGDPWRYLQPTTEIDGTLVMHHRKMDRRWWRAQAVRYLMRFKTKYTCGLLNVARHSAFGMQAAKMVVDGPAIEWPKAVVNNGDVDMEHLVWSDQKPWMPRPLLSMHVRMGDKACEMNVVGFRKYMQLANRIRKSFPNLKDIWLSSEMQEVINNSSLYSNWNFYYTNVTRQVGNLTMAVYEASLGRELSTNYPLVNFLMATEADFFIGALGSTWCYLIDGMRNTGGKVMAGYLSVNKDRFW